MHAVDQRHEIIREYLPKLIEYLTGFSRDEENFKRCEQFAWHTIKNHRNLSVNSHEIRRKIEGLQEKFIFENYKIYADHLQKLCNAIINHPICKNHYEVDVQWSILEFLFQLSYNPVGNLRENKHLISLELIEDENVEINKEQDYWTKLLKDEYMPLDRQDYDDSSLSDWSETPEYESSVDLKHCEGKLLIAEKPPIKTQCIIPGVPLEPPQKQSNFMLFDTTKAEDWLLENCQNSWWKEKQSDCVVFSSHASANFSNIWNSYLSDASNFLIKLEEISTETEYNLMREIIWMFHCPTNCKFFICNDDNIMVRRNVTIPSVSVNGLRIFLENAFIPYMKMQNELKNFIDKIYLNKNGISPKTYECYAACLREILSKFYDKILQIENLIKEQRPATITTIMQIRKKLDKDFQYLENIYNIHKRVIVDFQKTPVHISASYLLASLLACFRDSNSVESSNLCIVMFLASVQIYCNIADTWWSKGRLDDFNSEFLIEKANHNDEIIVRPNEKSKEKSFFVANNVSKCIKKDCFLKILLDHSLEASCTLNLLYRINKIGNLQNAYNIEENLYDTFIQDVCSSIKEIRHANLNLETCENSSTDNVRHSIDDEEYSINKFLNDCSSMNDEFLLMAFASNLTSMKSTSKESKQAVSIFLQENEKSHLKFNSSDLLEFLNESCSIIMPLEEIIAQSITRILQNRISFANSFVMNMYKNEFEILKSLQNIRKVLLMESSDLLQFFYVKIFNEIEDGKEWIQPFALSVQLDDIMTSRYPEVSSLFRVEIDSISSSGTLKVTEAIDKISVYYNLRPELQYIITESSQENYNKVFRFLLKVKWGLWTLENLKFSHTHKHRKPYAKLNLIDLCMRRLEQLRFWMMYSLQNIHFHLMTIVLHSMGQQLDKKINNCLNLTEMKSVHKSYINKICEYCFQVENNSDICVGVIQLLNLIYVLKVEWNSCINDIDNSLTLSDLTDSIDLNNTSVEEHRTKYLIFSQIETIEQTYIRCHEYLAKTLDNQVYIKQNNFLSGLSAAFNTNIPY